VVGGSADAELLLVLLVSVSLSVVVYGAICAVATAAGSMVASSRFNAFITSGMLSSNSASVAVVVVVVVVMVVFVFALSIMLC